MKLVAYLRVSSDGQFDGYGFDIQRTAIRAWAKHNGHKIVAEFQDAVSGTLDSDERPQMLKALEMLRRRQSQIEGLVVAKFDRLARKLTVQEALLALVWREGGKVFTAEDGEIKAEDPDDPMRDLIRQMMGAFAEFDRKTVVKRMRDGRRLKAQAGQKAEGQYLYGTHGVGKRGRDRDAGPNPEEHQTITRIMGLRRGGSSYRQIVDNLHEAGIRPRRAQRWSPMTVRNIVLREELGATPHTAPHSTTPHTAPHSTTPHTAPHSTTPHTAPHSTTTLGRRPDAQAAATKTSAATTRHSSDRAQRRLLSDAVPAGHLLGGGVPAEAGGSGDSDVLLGDR